MGACLTKHFFRFVASRSLLPSEGCLADDWATRFEQGGHRLSELFSAYVESEDFALRKDDRL